jgi:hypothetical protein
MEIGFPNDPNQKKPDKSAFKREPVVHWSRLEAWTNNPHSVSLTCFADLHQLKILIVVQPRISASSSFPLQTTDRRFG